MKNLKRYLSFVAIFSLLFTSCSKDEAGMLNSDSEKATVSFGAIVNDLVTNRAASKQAVGDLPDCSDDTPAYVRVVLMQGDEEVVGTSTSPYRVNLVAGEIFTVEDAELELEPGNYTLEHFSVYNSNNEVIWIAPRTGSDLGAYVDTTLPLAIDLRAGVKKYVDVPVLCFDNREVNEYGYLFFELDTNVALTYCFFANYCDDDGMHYPANYSISIWSGSDANGVALYTNETNFTGRHNNGDYYATPLCLALPDNDDLDEEYLYYEMTLLDWEDNYGDVEEVMISGTITKREILANFGDDEDDNVEYEHVRFCDDAGEPVGDRDNDNIPDNVDECPDEAGPASNDGCPEDNTCDAEDPAADCDGDGTLNRCDADNPNYGSFDCDNDNIANSEDDCPAEAGVPGPDGENGCPEDNTCDAGDPAADCDGDGTLNRCDPDNPNYGSFDCDNDNIINSEDDCPAEAGVSGPEGENGCPAETDPCQGLPAVCDVDFGTLPADCYVSVLEGADANGYIKVEGAGTINIMQTVINEDWGDAIVSITATGSIMLSIDGALPSDKITAYEVEVVKSENGTMSSTCRESQCDSSVGQVTGDQPDIEFTFDGVQYSYPFYLKVNTVICESVVGE